MWLVETFSEIWLADEITEFHWFILGIVVFMGLRTIGDTSCNHTPISQFACLVISHLWSWWYGDLRVCAVSVAGSVSQAEWHEWPGSESPCAKWSLLPVVKWTCDVRGLDTIWHLCHHEPTHEVSVARIFVLTKIPHRHHTPSMTTKNKVSLYHVLHTWVSLTLSNCRTWLT